MLKEEILSYVPKSKEQEEIKRVFQDYYNFFGTKLLDRELELLHTTSSSIILNETLDKMLMCYHNIYKHYGWQGGHSDNLDNQLEVAIKEAKEETSLKDLRVFDKCYSLDILPVMPHIKRGKYVPCHLHLNFTYVMIASESDYIHIKEDENSDIKWIPIDQMDTFVNEEAPLEIYKRVIKEFKEEYNELSRKN